MTLSGGDSAAAGSDRSFRFGNPPKDAMPLALTATAVSAALLLFGWFTLFRLDLALASIATSGTGVRIVLILVGLCLLYPLWPASNGLRSANRARRAQDFVEARVAVAASRQSSWIAIGLSGAVLLGAAIVQFLIANDLKVSKTFFYLPLMRDTFGQVLGAAWVNVYIFMVSEVLVLIWALVIAVARLAPGEAGRPIRMLATAYTDVFRGLPVIINVYLIGFGISLSGLPYLKDWAPETFAIIALTLTSSAYVAEVYRAGIESVHRSQTAASRSLGLSHGQSLRFVIVPQAVRRILPPLLNNFISLQKDTALVNVIGSLDAFNQAKIIASSQFNLSAVSTVAFLFVLITIPQARFVDRLIERQRLTSRG